MYKNDYDLKVEVIVSFGNINNNVIFDFPDLYISKLHSEKTIHINEEDMDILSVNLEKATNYLIQLFYKTGQRYSCTRTKIGKLLSMVAFTYARDGVCAFKENIHKYDDCGNRFFI